MVRRANTAVPYLKTTRSTVKRGVCAGTATLCFLAPNAARGAEWPLYQSSPTHNGVVESTLGEAHWTLRLNGKVNGGLGFDGRNLYLDDFAGDVLSVRPESGEVKWRVAFDNVLMSTPIIAGGRVFVGTGSNAIMWDTPEETLWGRPEGDHEYAIDAESGKVLWTYASRGEAMPSPAYSKGRNFFANGNSQALALNASTGAVLWSAILPGIDTMASAMTADNSVYFVASRGAASVGEDRSHVIALNAADGALLWKRPYGNADCTPTLAQGMIFVQGTIETAGSANRGADVVDALDAKTGALRWEYHGTNGYFTAVGSSERAIAGTYSDGTLYQSFPADDRFVALDADSGRQRWSVSTSAPVKMSALVKTGRVFFGDTAGVLYVLDANDGRVLKSIAYPKPFTASPFLIVGRTMFLINSDVLYALPLAELEER